MDEKYHMKIEEMKKDFEKLMNKKLDEERKNILESILQIVPDADKHKIIDIVNNKPTKKINKEKGDGIIDILDYIGKRGEENVFKDCNGKLYNQKAELIGIMNDNKPFFYTDGSEIDKELNLDGDLIKKIGFIH